jgi:hypothetical protein
MDSLRVEDTEQADGERREMLTAHRIFIIAKNQPKAR